MMERLSGVMFRCCLAKAFGSLVLRVGRFHHDITLMCGESNSSQSNLNLVMVYFASVMYYHWFSAMEHDCNNGCAPSAL